MTTFRGPDPVLTRHVPRDFGTDEYGLTAVDRDTLQRLAQHPDASYTELAGPLGLDRHAMGARARHLYRALEVDDRAGVVAAGRRLGYLSSSAEGSP